MTEFINLLNIINCNFNTDNNVEIQLNHLKIQLKNLEDIHNDFHKHNDCDCTEYLIKKELLSKAIKYLESILYQVMNKKDRELIKQIQETLDKETKKKKTKSKNDSTSTQNKTTANSQNL